MLTPEQLKGKIRNVGKEKSLSSQEILQMYLFERILERLSKSKYSMAALHKAFPDRRIVPIYAMDLNIRGGGIHCSTKNIQK